MLLSNTKLFKIVNAVACLDAPLFVDRGQAVWRQPEDEMKSSSSQIMTAKQLAEYLQMSQITICRLAREKKLPGLKIGKEWRFQKELIDRLLVTGSSFDEMFAPLKATGGDHN